MTTMKGAVFFDVRDVQVVDVPRPEVGDNGVMINVKAVGVCGTDVHTYKTGVFKEMSIPTVGGYLFGHEFSGEVTEMAPNLELEGIAVGDRVAGITLGAYSEYCVVDDSNFGEHAVFKIPDNISYEEAATIEPLTVSLSAVRRADPQPGERVLILGAGMIGLGCVQILKTLYPGCEVIISDLSEKRLDMAREFGADRTINAAQEDLVAEMKAATGETPVLYNSKTTAHVNVVIDCAGIDITVNQALEVISPDNGRIILIALYEDTSKLDLNQLVTKNVTMKGVLAYQMDDFRECMALMASGKIDRLPLISHRFSLDNASDAFEAQINTADTLKAVITNH